MKKVLIAMLAMSVFLIGGAGILSSFFSLLLGGGPEQSYLYPIYGGIIVLTGVVVGAADVIVNEIKDLKKSISDRINNNIDIMDNF